jgi:hypothetical protein
MTKVSNIKSSTAHNNKNAEFETVDELGRKYVLRRPSYLKGLQLAKALGELAENTVYYQSVYYFSWIKSIDGVDVSIGSVLEIEALAARIDHEGVIAIREKIFEIANASAKTPEELKVQAEEEEKATQTFAKK